MDPFPALGAAWPGWRIQRSTYLPEEDGLYESLFALTDGRIGVRAVVDHERAVEPACLHAELYGPSSDGGRVLLGAPDPTWFRLLVAGRPVALEAENLAGLHQALDLRRAIQELDLIARDAAGRSTRLRIRRLLPARWPQTILSFLEAQALDHGAELGIQWGVRRPAGAAGGLCAVALCRELVPGASPRLADVDTPACVSRAAACGPLRLTQLAAIATGTSLVAARQRCSEALAGAARVGIARLLREHEEEWSERWRLEAAEIRGPAELEEGARFAAFHLMQAAPREGIARNVPARGLTSTYHGGHVFFNSDLFLAPWYTLTCPGAARALTRHRVESRGAALRYARRTGFDGLRYPVRVDAAGRAVPCPLSSTEREGEARVVHMSACVLYGLSDYLELSGESGLLDADAAETVAGIARYCRSVLRPVGCEGALSTRGVMGFDEDHPLVDDHYATNFLLAWALRRSADLLDGPESSEWRASAGAIRLPAADARGLLPQFSGYFRRRDAAPATAGDRFIGRSTHGPDERSQLIKQADLILLFALFPDAFERPQLAANFDYYEPRTRHASSLSLGPHALVAARLERLQEAAEFISAALRYNLDFRPRSGYRNGVHLGGYAGAFTAVARGLLGLRAGRPVSLDPRLPSGWQAVRLPLHTRAGVVGISVEREAVILEHLDGEVPIELAVGDSPARIGPGVPPVVVARA